MTLFEQIKILLHGDFWPGNLLWLNGQLSGIIDWENARLGDPLSDLSNARLEFLWAFDWQAMLTFTDHYHLVSGKKSVQSGHLECDYNSAPQRVSGLGPAGPSKAKDAV